MRSPRIILQDEQEHILRAVSLVLFVIVQTLVCTHADQDGYGMTRNPVLLILGSNVSMQHITVYSV